MVPVVLCCPHARGGGPTERALADCLYLCCPHARGDGPLILERHGSSERVVPTLVGMDRDHNASQDQIELSPRSWGWTVIDLGSRVAIGLLPRSWGWTVYRSSHHVVNAVVPTLVGVDRTASRCSRNVRGCPHARGDGPKKPELKKEAVRLSPTLVGVDRLTRFRTVLFAGVVPTLVGMDRHRGRLIPPADVVPTLVGVDRRHRGQYPTSQVVPTLVGVDLKSSIEDACPLVVPTLVGVDRMVCK